MQGALQGTLTFLGSGTSMGVPSLGCGCPVCTSPDPHDTRLRPSIMLRWPCSESSSADAPAQATAKAPRGRKGYLPFPPIQDPQDGPCERIVLVDTGPDFRQQALRERIKRVDTVFYTHSHADHIFGLDDLRPLSFAAYRQSGPIPLYATPETRAVLEHIFAYTFSPKSKYTNRAKVALHNVDTAPIRIQEVTFIPIPVLHGELPITGYRFGNAAYITDVSTIPESSFALLEGLDVLIVSALRHTPHPSHATLNQAVRWASRVGARQTWFTHISHELGHAETNAHLPEGMALAHDGLTLPVTLA